ncbi:MAG TPA: MBL fold metallo-hydrolase [Burkholderiales bacterium]|jgi:glyoxylase-like metal-dependent hydrolase (beta-lactamase superfamily II)/8-oxo-dGTP pyrophosphatase MutT (NUDIX family)|nr:MBL fold metallo-hydrolase [Burkholderiales bacterium]
MSAKAEPRPAATIILLRDADAGPEVFMLQRTRGAAFLPGAYVFPGGALDASDRDPRAAQRVAGLSDAQASAELGLGAGGLAYWIAAARECFEEAGILIAVQKDGAPVAPARAQSLQDWREPLNAGKRAFAELLEQEDLFVPASEIVYFAHWITAAGRPRRFNTRFFLARAPRGQDGAHDQTETVHSFWISPREALERHERQEIEVIFPTRTSLADIARFTTASAAVEHARGLGDIEVNAAVWALDHEGSKRLFRRADPAYFEIHWSDPGETGETCFVIQPGIAKRLDRLVTRLTAPNPGVMTGPGTNTYLVGENEISVIDPGPAIDDHVAAIVAAGAGRIRWILCTHTHVDHSPAAALLKARTGATVIGRPRPEHGNQDHTFAPDRVLEHGERIELGGVRFRALHTPGHASNHLCYLLEETKMLFTGDHVMQGSTVVINPPDGDMRTYLASLDLLLHEDVAILAPGHGHLIGGPHKEVQRLIRHRLAREAKVTAAISRLGSPALEEMLPLVYDDVHPRIHAVAARSLTAHLEKLVAEGKVRASGGRYSLA